MKWLGSCTYVLLTFQDPELAKCKQRQIVNCDSDVRPFHRTMTTLILETPQVVFGGDATLDWTTPVQVLSQSYILSTAGSIIQTYPSFKSAYLFGSNAKGTARPCSDVGIVVFAQGFNFVDIGGAHMDLEKVFGKKVDLLVSPPDDFMERIEKYWVPITLS